MSFFTSKDYLVHEANNCWEFQTNWTAEIEAKARVLRHEFGINNQTATIIKLKNDEPFFSLHGNSVFLNGKMLSTR